MSGYFAGAIVDVKKKDGKYSVKQVQREKSLSLPVQGQEDSQLEISWSFGPLTVTGYFNTETLKIRVEVSVLRIILDSFYGNLKDSVVINFDLKLAKGSIKFYLKNENKFWVCIDIDVIFDGLYHKDIKLLLW
ncbi:hypothetical protein MMC22_002258 [Lobaria immixta]|nr:hypothetical protein [Lobaria immixta]